MPVTSPVKVTDKGDESTLEQVHIYSYYFIFFLVIFWNLKNFIQGEIMPEGINSHFDK